MRHSSQTLVATSSQHDHDELTGQGAHTGDFIEEQLAKVRAWASSLDRDRYQAHETPEGLYIQATPPEDVVQALQPSDDDLKSAQEEIRLSHRYYIEPKKQGAQAIGPDELTADIATARKLLENPPALGAYQPWDTPALVAAAALEAHFLHGANLPDDALAFAAGTVLRVGEGEAWPRQDEIETTSIERSIVYFEQGADRSAARALPLLLLPAAAQLRAIVDDTGGSATFERAAAASLTLARAVASEVRLHLARGLDRLWETACADGGRCHHELGLQLAIETMRDCVLGDWNPDTGERSVVALDEPIAESLENTPGKSIFFNRLDAAIRSLAPAAAAGICVSTRAHAMLLALLAAQRRSLLANEDNIDYRGTHALVRRTRPPRASPRGQRLGHLRTYRCLH